MWLIAKQRLYVKSELMLPKGEKSKHKKKVDNEAALEMREVESSELDLKEMMLINSRIVLS